jgi:glycosyltransferase involved in cell wall biosynthesis
VTTGIRWLSVGPGSGYGNASEDYLSGLRSAGVPVNWTPLGWPAESWEAPFGPVLDLARHQLENALHRDIIDCSVEHDTVVVYSTPLWDERLAAEAAGRRLAAYSTWETDRLWPEWVEALNHYDQVLVPSHFNAQVFLGSGVTAPVRVVPHLTRLRASPADRAGDGSEGTFRFYLIATWTTRKAILDAVAAYLLAFDADDDVSLLIHTTPQDLVAAGRPARPGQPPTGRGVPTWYTLAEALAGRRHVPQIKLSTQPLTRAEVDALHRSGDCFVSLSRGEGWGLCAFDAGAVGNPVIITGWGGSRDFLPRGYPYCVDYDLIPTLVEEPDAWWQPRPRERWAKAHVAHAATLLRHVYEHLDEARAWGATLRSNIRQHFNEKQVIERLLEVLA